jgi:hypothetical protein
MQIHWESIDQQLKSPKTMEDEAIQADFFVKERVRRALHEETIDIAAALVALGQRLAAAGFQVTAGAIMPDYWVKVGDQSVGIQVNLAGPSWLVLNDGQQTDEIVRADDGERSYWALATEPATAVDLPAYFGQQFTAFVARVQAEDRRH